VSGRLRGRRGGVVDAEALGRPVLLPSPRVAVVCPLLCLGIHDAAAPAIWGAAAVQSPHLKKNPPRLPRLTNVSIHAHTRTGEY
jgi:hypothetical protein